MLLSAVSVLVVAQSSSEIPEGLVNNPVFNESQVRYEHVKNHSAFSLFSLLFNEVKTVKAEETVYIRLYRLLNYFKEI